jgi:ketosteroid isomerase-like protein
VTESDVALFETWRKEAEAADDWLGYWYDHVWAEDIDYRAVEGALDDAGPIIGRDAMRAYVADWFEMFSDLRLTAEEIRDVAGQVIVRWRLEGTANASGVPTELRVFIVYTLRDGKIVRGREYMTAADAEASVTA